MSLFKTYKTQSPFALDAVLEELLGRRTRQTGSRFESAQDRYARTRRQVDRYGADDELLHAPIKFRAVFKSDLHLGTSSALARDWVQCDEHIDAEYYFLNGDICDFWKMKPRDFWKLLQQESSQHTVIQKILKRLRKGNKTIYIPGNHDEVCRDIIKPYNKQALVNNLDIVHFDFHETLQGKRFLVMHGDSFDELVRGYRLLSILSARAYERLASFSMFIDECRANAHFNHLLNSLGLDKDYSLAHALRNAGDKASLNKAFEKAAFACVSSINVEITAHNKAHPSQPEKMVDGIICGHTHFAARTTSELCTYMNSGHWTGPPRKDKTVIDESWRDRLAHPVCTFVAEDMQGKMGMYQWRPKIGIVPLDEQYPDGKFKNPSAQEAYERMRSFVIGQSCIRHNKIA